MERRELVEREVERLWEEYRKDENIWQELAPNPDLTIKEIVRVYAILSKVKELTMAMYFGSTKRMISTKNYGSEQKTHRRQAI